MKRKFITILCVFGLWQVLSLIIQKEVILPLPLYVFERMFELTMSSVFYEAIIATLLRVLMSFLIACFLGTFLGMISGMNQMVYDYLSPIMTFLQTIPQIGYILILLVWFQSTTALIMIILLMILPIFYHSAVNGVQSIQSEYLDIMKVYYHPFSYNLIHVYLPLMRGYILSSIETSLSMALKVGVMAEIFVSSKQGIGKQLYFARIQIDMISIFAWMIWMVILIMMISFFVHKIIKLFPEK